MTDKTTHIFNVAEAKKYGIEGAILLSNLRFWLDKNKANEKNIHDGRVWTYNSTRAFCELFPYWNEFQIKKILKKLRDAEIILAGNYNKVKYDRTLWYTINEDQYVIFVPSIVLKRSMEGTKKVDGKCGKGRPIPDINTDIKPYIREEGACAPVTSKKSFIKPSTDEVAVYCQERHNGIDAHRFWDFYESKGWKVGKNGMKDWRACVRTWETSQRGKSGHNAEGFDLEGIIIPDFGRIPSPKKP